MTMTTSIYGMFRASGGSVNRWKIWLGIIVIFLSGAVVGGASTALYARKKIHEMMREGGPFMRARMVEKLTEKLQLAPEQRRKVEEIVNATRDEIHQSGDEKGRRFEAMRKGGDRIREVLNPEQQTRFDELRRRMEERWQRRLSENPSGYGLGGGRFRRDSGRPGFIPGEENGSRPPGENGPLVPSPAG